MKSVLPGLIFAGALASLGCQEQIGSPATALATGEFGVTSIAVDDGFVYWSKADGTIKRVSLDSGAVDTLSKVPGSTGNLALDDANLYWSVDRTLCKLPKAGGTAAQFVQKGNIQRISLDDLAIYWSDESSVSRVTKEGEDAVALAPSENPLPVLAGRANLLWGSGSTNAGAVINQVPVAGGVATELIENQHNVVSLATDATNLYWADRVDGSGGTINVAALDGSSSQVVAAGEQVLVSVLTDSTNVYWSNAVGQVRFAAVAGGGAMPLVDGPFGTVSIAADATNLYWANSGDDAILTMPKP